jgi:hypothetical protein
VKAILAIVAFLSVMGGGGYLSYLAWVKIGWWAGLLVAAPFAIVLAFVVWFIKIVLDMICKR